MSWKRLFDLFKLRLKDIFSGSDPELATKFLITANLVSYAGWQRFPDFMKEHFIMSEENTIKNQKYYTIATSSVSQDDFRYTMLNSIALWFISKPLAQAVGGGGVLAIYATGALFNFLGLYYEFTYQNKEIPKVQGALAPIGAALGYFFITHPWEEFIIFFIPVPAILVGAGILYLGSASNENAFLYGAGGSVFFKFLRLLRR